MIMKPACRIGAALLAACTWACSEKAPEGGVPLPPAYPRIAAYPQKYAPVDSFPANWEANAECRTTVDHGRDRAVFASTDYAAYRGKLMVTFTPVDDNNHLDKVIDNRLERMSLNTGGHQSELTTFETSAGFNAKILITRVSSPTPVQFLAEDGRRVVSGALMLDTAPTSADSIAPVIETVRRDIIHALTHLR